MASSFGRSFSFSLIISVSWRSLKLTVRVKRSTAQLRSGVVKIVGIVLGTASIAVGFDRLRDTTASVGIRLICGSRTVVRSIDWYGFKINPLGDGRLDRRRWRTTRSEDDRDRSDRRLSRIAWLKTEYRSQSKTKARGL